jgi:guanylate kinase
VDGEHYHFVSKAAFAELVAARAFLESANVHGNSYGTSKAAVHAVADTGKICILDIDIQVGHHTPPPPPPPPRSQS